MNFHGYSQSFFNNEPLFLSDTEGPQVVWQTKEQDPDSLIKNYLKKVSTFFCPQGFL